MLYAACTARGCPDAQLPKRDLRASQERQLGASVQVSLRIPSCNLYSQEVPASCQLMQQLQLLKQPLAMPANLPELDFDMPVQQRPGVASRCHACQQ